MPTEEDILHQMRSLFPHSERIDSANVKCATALPGAYALLLRLDTPAWFSRRTLASSMPEGWYVYAGSARGGGGIGARLRRHFRRDKKVHWHIDDLTSVAAHMVALALPGGEECNIVATLVDSGGYVPALAGFGSSDCSRCTAHLLKL